MRQRRVRTRSDRGTSRPAAKAHGERQAAQIAVNSYCLREYGVGYSGGTPQRLSVRGDEVWIVSAVLTSPGYGVVGEVGLVAVDPATCEILGATPREEVRAAGARLAEENRDGLDAAFRRTRKA